MEETGVLRIEIEREIHVWIIENEKKAFAKLVFRESYKADEAFANRTEVYVYRITQLSYLNPKFHPPSQQTEVEIQVRF